MCWPQVKFHLVLLYYISEDENISNKDFFQDSNIYFESVDVIKKSIHTNTDYLTYWHIILPQIYDL